MNAIRASFFSITPQAFWNWGRLVLGGGLALGLALLAYLTWQNALLLYFFPLALLGGAAVWYLTRHPLLNLSVILAGFTLVISYSEGINVLEVLYGLYALGYLACWFVSRTCFYGERILDTVDAKALFLFIMGATASVALSLLFGARPGALFSEWTALLLLCFYFPIREACIRYDAAPAIIVAMLGWIGLYVAIRNGLDYYAGLNSAEHLFQILKNRSDMNSNLMMSIAFFYLAFLIFAVQWRHRVLLFGGFILSSGSLLLSQSRAMWICFAFGAFLMFLLVRRPYKGRMIALGLLAGGSMLGMGLLFFGDTVLLILGGLIDRIATLGRGANDFSLKLRALEAQGALVHIVKNPILGHGVGVPFTFFDAETERTVSRTFIHNGYVALWYRFGLWGLALVLFFWLRSTWHGFAVFRQARAPMLLRLCGLSVGLSLVAFLISANTSNPLHLKDTTFLFGVLTGLAAGARARAQLTDANA